MIEIIAVAVVVIVWILRARNFRVKAGITGMEIEVKQEKQSETASLARTKTP